ncbi:MAG: HD-GYP domain-containing protein [Spirochaetaceae bacterium]|nr:MAG: HD-GYP domain-containing protein [Spirochaetaceae bacterium]
MKEITIDNLKPGMKFDAPVYIDDHNILVPPGIPIREKDIERLKRWEIKHVSTDGNTITDSPEGDNLEKSLLSDLFDEKSDSAKAATLYDASVRKFIAVLDSIKKRQKHPKETIDSIVNDIFSVVKDEKNEIVQLVLHSERSSDDFAANAIACAIISIIIGMNMKLVGHKILSLACGALLHDMGMTRIPDSIRNKKEDLNAQDFNTIRTHTIHSYSIIVKEMKYPEEIGQIALYHHERWDGKGYPKNVSGENIPLFARIVSVADAYVAMINERPYRDQMIGYDAIKNIISDNFKRFDPAVVKSFLKGMGIYPIGSIVLLNDSSIGRVVSTHASAPLRPRVEIIMNQRGEKVDDELTINLHERSDLFIMRAIDPKMIRMDRGAMDHGAMDRGAMGHGEQAKQ